LISPCIIDKKLRFDISEWNYKAIRKDLVQGILAAQHCTDFAVSGAQYWTAKDLNGTTKATIQPTNKVLCYS